MVEEEFNKPFHPPKDDLPRAILREAQDNRFEEIMPDYFWAVANWAFSIIIFTMGLVALKDMFMGNYNWATALSWVTTAMLGLGAMAFIHKSILKK